jgi:lipopolysaccharide export system permease protein
VALLDRYLAREILLPFGAGLLFLTQLLLATSLLGQADILFGSGVSLLDVGAVMLGVLPQFLSFVLPIAFLLGAVLGVGRLAEDREVVALGAAGISPLRLIRVPLLLSLVIAGLGLWLGLEVEPASLRAARLRFNEIVKRNVTNDVRAGTFYDQIPNYTLYAERVHGGRWENVLIHDRSNPAAPVLALARAGHLEPVGAGQEMRLVLERGEVHRDEARADDGSAADYAIAGFERADLVLGLGTALTDRRSVTRSSREQNLEDMRERVAQARARGDERDARRWEGYLHRKLSAPLAVIAFAILSVPLGASRFAGRAFGVGATFVVIVVHYLLLRGGEVMSQLGQLPTPLALQLPNVVLILIGVGLAALLARRGPGAVR